MRRLAFYLLAKALLSNAEYISVSALRVLVQGDSAVPAKATDFFGLVNALHKQDEPNSLATDSIIF